MIKQPFKFLDAYNSDDKEIFFGRTKETKELYSRVFFSDILLVYGNSGVGKTSLIQCGLANKFNETDWFPITISPNQGILNSLQNELLNLKTTNSPETKSFSQIIRSIYLEHFKPIYLIFDQLEELFIFENKEKRIEFVNELQKLLNDETDVKIIFIIREEYLAGLTEFEPLLPNLFENKIRIENMSHNQAIEVIEGPCKKCGINYEENLAAVVLNNIVSENKNVELTYLQVIMDKLYKIAIENEPVNPIITCENVNSLGKLGDVLGDLLKEQLSIMPDGEAGEAVLKTMVSIDGTRKRVKAEEVDDVLRAMGNNLTHSTIQSCLQYFVTVRIIKEKDENGYYDLRHDSLAGKIYERMSAIEKDLFEVSQMLENRYIEYNKRGILLDAESLKFIAPYEDRLRLKKKLTLFIDQSKRAIAKKRRFKMFLTVIVAALIFLIVSALAVFSYFKAIDAEKQRREAINQKEIALKEEQNAKLAREEAERQSTIAKELKEIAEKKAKETEEQLAKTKHNLGLVFNEKAKLALKDKDYNSARLYSLFAASNFKSPKVSKEFQPIKHDINKYTEYPIIFSLPISNCSDGISDVKFSPDGKTIVSGSDKTIKLWDVKTGDQIWSVDGITFDLNEISFSQDGEFISAVSNKGEMHFFAKETGDIFAPNYGLLSSNNNMTDADYTNFVFSNDCKLVGSCFWLKGLQLWDIKNGNSIINFNRKAESITGLSFSADSISLFYGFAGLDIDGHNLYNSEISNIKYSGIRSLNIKTNEEKTLFKGDKGKTICALSPSPNDKYICFLEFDYDFQESELIVCVLSEENKTVEKKTFISNIFMDPLDFELDFSSNGKVIAYADDKSVKLYNIQTNNEIAELKGHTSDISGLDFSHDDKLLVSSDTDGNIKLWDVATGKDLSSAVNGHSNRITSIAFLNDGKTLAGYS